MSTKTLIGALIGAVVFWMMGFIMYVLLVGKMIAQYTTANRPHGEEMMVHLILGQLVFGLLLAWLWSRMGITTFSRGLTSGAIVGFLSALGANLITFATMTVWTDPVGIIYDVIALTVIWAVTGGVVGWYMGYSGRSNKQPA